jgi:hypothetical protein
MASTVTDKHARPTCITWVIQTVISVSYQPPPGIHHPNDCPQGCIEHHSLWFIADQEAFSAKASGTTGRDFFHCEISAFPTIHCFR